MANQLLTTQELTRETLMPLENNTITIPNMYRGYDDAFGKAGAKIGDTLYVRKPQKFIGRDGQAYQPEGLTDTQTPVIINNQSGVDFQMSSQELKLDIDLIRERYLNNGGIAIGNKLDYRAINTMTLNTSQFVGTPGTTPGLSSTDAILIYSQAGQKLDEAGFQLKGRKRQLIFTPAMRVAYLAYTKTLFNPTNLIGEQTRTGQIVNGMGYDIGVDQNINALTVGALGGTPQVTGGGQTGSTINLKTGGGAVTNYFLGGEVLTFASTFAVSPQAPFQSNGSLKQFVVQSPISADGGGLLTGVQIYPSLVSSGQYQNASASPADNDLVTVNGVAAAGQSAIANGTFPQALLFDEMAFTFVSVPLDVPEGVDMGSNMSAYSENDSPIGVKLRFVRQYIGATDQWINRFDVIYGASPLYPEGCCRITA